MRFSLFTKIMLWFFLNLLLLAAIFALLFNFRFAPNTPIFRGTDYRIETVARRISEETNEKSRAERDQILKVFSDDYAVEFFMFDSSGRQIAGREINLPSEILKAITAPEPEFVVPPPRRNGEQNLPGELPARRPPSSFGSLSSYLKTSDPTLYWYATKTMTFEAGASEPTRSRIVAASESFLGNRLFFDPTPWLVTVFIVVVVSVLFWLPFVRRLTGNLAEMTAAAEQIAEENFDARVSERRPDEIGRLGKSINHLATRLSDFLKGQKRFLGDISHELNSPLARMNFALQILEDRTESESSRQYIADVKEEVELMSRLVAELLAFSKAGMRAAEAKCERVDLLPLVERIVERETTATDDVRIKIEIAGNAAKASAQPELLARALGNVVRNAVRYAREAGEITVKTEKFSDGEVKITVADKGAGVPAEALVKIFDPLYRIESHRSRETGGSGLGLAIVKTCVEACGGRAFAENLKPRGFAVSLVLKG